MLVQKSLSNLVEELNQVIGNKLLINVNAYVQAKTNEGFSIFIDPSGLTDNDENMLTDYARQSGFMVDETWNDW